MPEEFLTNDACLVPGRGVHLWPVHGRRQIRFVTERMLGKRAKGSKLNMCCMSLLHWSFRVCVMMLFVIGLLVVALWS